MSENKAINPTAKFPEQEPPKVLDSSQSPTIGKLALALAKAQGEMEGAKKSEENPFFRSKYADLHSCWDAVRKPLSKNGLAVIQTTDGDTLITTLAHESGEWIKGKTPLVIPQDKKRDMQGLGSAITYARRYALAAITGIAQVDDDAESVAVPENRQTKKPSNGKGKQSAFKNASVSEDQCGLCGEALRLSAKGNGKYCPNFQDKSKGDHTYIKLGASA